MKMRLMSLCLVTAFAASALSAQAATPVTSNLGGLGGVSVGYVTGFKQMGTTDVTINGFLLTLTADVPTYTLSLKDQGVNVFVYPALKGYYDYNSVAVHDYFKKTPSGVHMSHLGAVFGAGLGAQYGHFLASVTLGGFYESRTLSFSGKGENASESESQGGFYVSSRLGYSSIDMNSVNKDGLFVGVESAIFIPTGGDDSKDTDPNRYSIGIGAAYHLSF